MHKTNEDIFLKAIEKFKEEIEILELANGWANINLKLNMINGRLREEINIDRQKSTKL
jgi:hypothetical protein